MARAIVGLLSAACLAGGSLLLARRALGQSRGLAWLLAGVTLFWSVVTLGCEALGLIGGLSLIGAWVLGVTTLVVGCCWPRARGSVAESAQSCGLAWEWEAVVAVGLLLGTALPLVLQAFFLAVRVMSDGPIYHLYFAARWMRAGALELVAAPFGENAATYFPANGDVWFTWLMVLWGGDRLARAGQAPFLIVSALAVYGSARSLGVGRSASGLAAAWFVASTPFLIFSATPNVDTIFIAGQLVAVFFILGFRVDPKGIAPLVLAGLAAGLALGTKAVGVVFIPPLLGLGVIVVWRAGGSLRARLGRTAILLCTPLLTAGYWFGRNWLLTGNPFYPLLVRLGGRTIFTGWYGPDAMKASPFYIPVTDWRALVDILLAVLDPRLAPWWAAAAAFGLAGLGFRKGEPGADRAFCRGALAGLALLTIALYWLVIPYRTQQRFMLQALGFTAVPLACWLDRWRILRVISCGLLAVHLATPECWPWAQDEGSIPWDLRREIPNAIDAPWPLLARVGRALDPDPARRSFVPAAGLLTVMGVSLWVVWIVTRSTRWTERRRWLAGSGWIALFAAGLGDLALNTYDARIRFYPPFADFYAGWLQLDYQAGPRGSSVAYAGTNLPYYLLGEGLRNRVRYVNINRHRHWLLHDYHRDAARRGQGVWPNSRPGWDRQHPDYDAWLANLEDTGIELLVVTRVNTSEGAHNVADRQGFPIERLWADAHPDRFLLLYGEREHDPAFRLYRFRGSTRRSDGPKSGFVQKMVGDATESRARGHY